MSACLGSDPDYILYSTIVPDLQGILMNSIAGAVAYGMSIFPDLDSDINCSTFDRLLHHRCSAGNLSTRVRGSYRAVSCIDTRSRRQGFPSSVSRRCTHEHYDICLGSCYKYYAYYVGTIQHRSECGDTVAAGL